MKKSVAVIPARGGSKRIPRKNVRNFCGQPMISYSVKSALCSGCFDRVIVSTDDEEIAEAAVRYGAEVPFLRSKKNSDDFAGIAEVMIEVLQKLEEGGEFYENLCSILPTSPLLSPQKINESCKIFIDGGYNALIPVVRFGYPIQRSLQINDGLVSMVWEENYSKRSQDLEPRYHDSGQFCWIKTEVLKNEKKFFVPNSYGLVLSELEVQDIDTEEDWKIAEFKYKILNSPD